MEVWKSVLTFKISETPLKSQCVSPTDWIIEELQIKKYIGNSVFFHLILEGFAMCCFIVQWFDI